MSRVVTTAIAALAALALPGARGQDAASASITTVPVADGIYMLMGAGGNIGVSVGPDGVLLIDDQFGPMVPKIDGVIAELSDSPVRMVLNTHWHGDHTGGNEAYGLAGALILAHDNVRVRMASQQFSAFFNRETPASPPAALPVVTFDNTLTLHLNGDSITALHVPLAHTDGDAIVLFEKANVVHMGDTYFNGFFPFIDAERGGTVWGVVRAIDTVLPRLNAQTRVMPGHGPLSDVAGLRRFRDMLEAVAQRIQSLKDEGRSVEEVVAAAPTAPYDAAWGGGFIKPEQWVRLAYSALGECACER